MGTHFVVVGDEAVQLDLELLLRLGGILLGQVLLEGLVKALNAPMLSTGLQRCVFGSMPWQGEEHFPCDVALEAADDLTLGKALCGPSSDI